MAALNALGSVSQTLSKQNSANTGTVRAIARSNPKPYLGREASYSGSAAVAPETQETRGNVGRQGTRAAAQYAAAFNAANGPREMPDEGMTNLDRLASTYNALVQQYRETPILTDPLRSATKELWDAYATTQLPTDSAREAQIFQEFTRMNATKPSQKMLDDQKAYFGKDLFGQDKDYERYSPLMPYINGDQLYYGDFQRQYVQRLLDEKLIPTKDGDKLAADVDIWKDFSKPKEEASQINANRDLTPALPKSANDVWLQFQGERFNVSPEDVYYNPKYYAAGFGDVFYDVFGQRVANSAWGLESDDGYADLMFPDAPYVTQGYAGKWKGDSRTLTDPKTEAYKIRTMTIKDDVPINPNQGERQIVNRKTTTEPITSEIDVPGQSLGTLTKWQQANKAQDTVVRTGTEPPPQVGSLQWLEDLRKSLYAQGYQQTIGLYGTGIAGPGDSTAAHRAQVDRYIDLLGDYYSGRRGSYEDVIGLYGTGIAGPGFTSVEPPIRREDIQPQVGGGVVETTRKAYGGSRSPMFDVRQNYNAKGFEDTTWEPFAYEARSPGDGQQYGLQRFGSSNPQEALTMGPIGYQANKDGSIQSGYRISDMSSGQIHFVPEVDLKPQYLSKENRLRLGYGE